MIGQNQTPERVTSETNQKTCVDCGTTKTPLWRGGPAGPKVSNLVYLPDQFRSPSLVCFILYDSV